MLAHSNTIRPSSPCQGTIGPIERLNFTGLCYVDTHSGENILLADLVSLVITDVFPKELVMVIATGQASLIP